MVGPWWTECASRLPTMPMGAGEALPCAGRPTLRCKLVLAHQPLRTSCHPAANPMEHPCVPRGAVGCGMGANAPARGPHADAREAVGAREAPWEIP
eukprot:7126689-Prymnesium_polylepis.1